VNVAYELEIHQREILTVAHDTSLWNPGDGAAQKGELPSAVLHIEHRDEMYPGDRSVCP
jgi:hypothetical protein